jgi:CheY-like chemotaxis protein
MKAKYLETRIRRHQLVPAFGEEEAVKYPVCAIATSRMAAPGARLQPFTTAAMGKTLLLVSADSSLGVRLWNTAELAELAFVQINDPARALQYVGQNRPEAVFLDLDLPALAGWEIAERLLQDEMSPSLVLLTGRTDHFDLSAAVRAGAIVAKLVTPAQLLKSVGGIRAELDADRVDRKARQRLLLRWLRPYDWVVPAAPAQRHWGINE